MSDTERRHAELLAALFALMNDKGRATVIVGNGEPRSGRLSYRIMGIVLQIDDSDDYFDFSELWFSPSDMWRIESIDGDVIRLREEE